MSQEISSLMDGELERDEAVRAIRSCCTSPEAVSTWETYHLIGEALRGANPHPTRTAERVRAALAAEPAIIARPKRVLDTTAGRVALAAAASVATIGVVGWIGSQGGQVSGGPMMATQPAASIQPVASKAPAKAAPAAPAVDPHDYYVAHKQLPSADLYRPVNRAVPATTAR